MTGKISVLGRMLLTVFPLLLSADLAIAAASVPNDHPLPWGLAETARDVLGRLPDFRGMPYGADARLLIDHGSTPTVLYGPGDPNLAHAPDEHVALEDVARCARVLAVWVMRALA